MKAFLFSGILLAAVALHPSGASAQAHVGLLLGLGIEESSQDQYRTLWIRDVGDGLELSGELNGLAVPYGSKLCRLATIATQTVDSESMYRPQTYSHAAMTLDCGDELPRHEPEAVPCNGESTIERVFFASRSHVAVKTHEESVCSGRVNSYDALSVMPLSAMVGRWVYFAARVPVEELGTAEAVAELERAAVQACLDADPDLLLFLPPCETLSVTDWTIVREPGGWLVLGRTAGWRGEDLTYRHRVPLTGFGAWTRRALSVEAVGRAAGDFQDFLTSPADDLAVVLRPELIQSGEIQSGRLMLGAALAHKRPRESIVSVEWATGPRVRIWDALVKELER